MDRADLQDSGQIPKSSVSKFVPPTHMVPPLVMSSSNVSTSTLDSGLVSPQTSQETNGAPIQSVIRGSTSPSATSTSEESVPVAFNVGSKRTASGTIKPASPSRTAESVQQRNGHVKRQSTIELSADLKTRLKYAMLKVQNGWESQNIEQLEQLPIASSKRATTESPLADWSRRLSISSGDNYIVSPMSAVRAPHDTSRVLQRQLQFPNAPPPVPRYITHESSPLAPPAQITSQRRPGRKSISSRFGPAIGRNRSTSSVSQGLTSREEQNAVESLMFMSSPKNQAGGGMGVFGYAESPSRHKRVEFDMTGSGRR